MSDFPKRLKEIRKLKKLTQKQVAEGIGIHPVVFQTYETGKTKPLYEIIIRLSLFLQVSSDYLLGLSNTHSSDPTDLRKIKLFNNYASAGKGTYAGEGEFEYIYVGEEVPANVNFAVRIKGDSMEPNIPDKSIAYIQSQPDVEFGEVCVFVLNGEGFCKVKTKDGFKSYNSKYDIKKIDEYDNLWIVGKVIHSDKKN
ncbi:MAG: LexA family transcriptional regulator [Defluviitaleaceae bacterium]|nr:LexA family transcriptional regulator [Defluviitaleaceae bacterium]